jgi:hypothetical protein
LVHLQDAAVAFIGEGSEVCRRAENVEEGLFRIDVPIFCVVDEFGEPAGNRLVFPVRGLLCVLFGDQQLFIVFERERSADTVVAQYIS